MANQPELRGIKNSWSLMAFAHKHGLPKPNHSTNRETGEEFDNLAFVDDKGAITFVAFSAKLGVLKPNEIMDRRNELQVIQLNDRADGKEGGYLLCNAGNINLGETINLFAEED